MKTTVKDGAIRTVTPFGLELVSRAFMYGAVVSAVWNGNVCIYLRVVKTKSKTKKGAEKYVETIHQEHLADFLKLATDKNLNKRIN